MAYIAISYVLMLIWAIVALMLKANTPKHVIKMLVIAPLSLPVLVFIKFISW